LRRTHINPTSNEISSRTNKIPIVSQGQYKGRPRFSEDNIDPHVSNMEDYKKLSTLKKREFLSKNEFILSKDDNTNIYASQITNHHSLTLTNAPVLLELAFKYWENNKKPSGGENEDIDLEDVVIRNPKQQSSHVTLSYPQITTKGGFQLNRFTPTNNFEHGINNYRDYENSDLRKKLLFLIKNGFVVETDDGQVLYAHELSTSNGSNNIGKTDADKIVKYAFKYWDSKKKPSGGSGLGGRKRKIKGNGLPIDTELGVEQIKYVPFGRYVLNKHHLFRNKVSLKTPYGKSVPNFPAKLVSENLTNVLNTIVGKGVPSFDDLNKLSEEEKQFLHKLASVSQISDKLSIPTPNKNEEQKDVNRFLILKGEIMAGNDSSQLIKEFKLLIIRLKNNGVLPKKEATDLLIELANLGY